MTCFLFSFGFLEKPAYKEAHIHFFLNKGLRFSWN